MWQDPQTIKVIYFQTEIPIKMSMQQTISLISHLDFMPNIIHMNACAIWVSVTVLLGTAHRKDEGDPILQGVASKQTLAEYTL